MSRQKYRGRLKQGPNHQFCADLPGGRRWFKTKRHAKKAIKLSLSDPASAKPGSRRSAYLTYLQSDEWKEIRNLVLKRDHATCILCHSTLFLNVHHRHYQTFQKETGEELATLCKGCHKRLHRKGWKAAGMGDLALRAVR